MKKILLILVILFTSMIAKAQDLTPLKEENTGKWGFVNYKTEWVIQPVLDDYYSRFWDGASNVPVDFATVKYKGKWGCLNKKGEFIVNPVFAEAHLAHRAGEQWQSDPERDSAAASGRTDTMQKNESQFTAGLRKLVKQGYKPQFQGIIPSEPSLSQAAPVIRIISPKNGSTYTDPNQIISYEVTTSGNIPHELWVSVDGQRISTPSMKGVKRASSEISVTLPRNTDKACNILLIPKDAKGVTGEPASLALYYAGEKPKPDLLVLAVGISEYDRQELKLRNASNDARDFVAAVNAMNTSLYADVNISSLLTDKEATFSNIRSSLSRIVKEAVQEDVVILFFSGHGGIEEDKKYYLPVDVQPDDLFSTAVNFEFITATAKRLKDRGCKVIIVMDACHSGALLGLKSAFSLDMSAPGISMLTSSTGNQQSKEYPEWRNGVFTKYLLDGLKGEAADPEGNITIDNLGNYVRNKVSLKDPAQSPLYSNEQRNFILFRK